MIFRKESLISAAPIKRQINPIKAAKTGKEPFKNSITCGPQFNGKAGITEKAVNPTKIIPTIIANIFSLNEYNLNFRQKKQSKYIKH